jgi:HlyD family secretion protein
MSNAKKIHWVRWLLTLLVLGGAVAGGYYWYERLRDGETNSPYVTATVSRGDVTQVVTATGQLNPVTNVLVGCQISGTIQKLYVDYNSVVTGNQVVAQIEPSTYLANLRQSLADLANTKAQLELAQVNEVRSRQLWESRLIPQSDYDQVVALLHQAQAQVIVKSAAVQRAQTDLDRCTIYSPISGIVIDRKVDVGQTVAASFNAPTLLIIANELRDMQIDANVAEADIGLVTVKQSVNFTVDAHPYQTFHGEVAQIRNAPITVQNVVTYDTVIKVSNDELRLKPGMTANISIVIAEHKNVVRVPNAALRVKMPKEKKMELPPETETREPVSKRRQGMQRQDQPVWRTLYVLPRGADGKLSQKPKPVKVRTSISDGAFTEALEGINEGDEIVTFVKQTSASTMPGGPPSPVSGMRRF